MTIRNTVLHPLVADYLRRLDQAAAALPTDRRAELIEGIREHLDAALTGPAGADERQVRDVLDRLGDPSEIVAVDGSSRGAPGRSARSGPGALEVSAAILLPIGGLVIPVIGWFVGLALLWASGRWTLRDKLIGTFVWPGGYLVPLILLMTPLESEPPPAWIGAPLSITLFVAPLVVVAYLLTRARRAT